MTTDRLAKLYALASEGTTICFDDFKCEIEGCTKFAQYIIATADPFCLYFVCDIHYAEFQIDIQIAEDFDD